MQTITETAVPTQPPWRVDKTIDDDLRTVLLINDGRTRLIAEVIVNRGGVQPEEAAANAELIVTAVNAYAGNQRVIAELDAQVSALKDAWLSDIRAHQDGCPASFSNCVPHDCACGLTELREEKMDQIALRKGRNHNTISSTPNA